MPRRVPRVDRGVEQYHLDPTEEVTLAASTEQNPGAQRLMSFYSGRDAMHLVSRVRREVSPKERAGIANYEVHSQNFVDPNTRYPRYAGTEVTNDAPNELSLRNMRNLAGQMGLPATPRSKKKAANQKKRGRK